MEIYFYLVLWVFIFHLLFIIFYVLNFFRIAKWWWLPWVSAVDLVEECHRLPIAEAPATFGERWGRVGGWWQGNGQCHWGFVESGWERDVESHEGWDCFKMQEINKQNQTKWFLFFQKKIICIDKLSLKISVLHCFKVYLCMIKTRVKTHKKRQGRENKILKNFAK